MRKILVIEFVTTVGGVQAVYKNILPVVGDHFDVYFIDPYGNEYDELLRAYENINVLHLPINSPSALGWEKGWGSKIRILIKYSFEYIKYIKKLISFIKKSKIELLYVSGKKEYMLAFLMNLLMHIPYVYHAHGFGSYKDITFIRKKCINKASRIIAVSQSVKDCMITAGIDANKIEVVYNGLNLREADKIASNIQSDKERADKDPFTIVFLGVIQPKKGLHLLIQAISDMQECDGFAVCLKVYGNVNDASYFEQLQALVREKNVNVQFEGYTNNVYAALQACTVLVLPSEEESFGMVLLEAMYMEKPVIGSRVGGIVEVVEEKKTGLLFEKGNAEDLYKALVSLYKDRDYGHSMGKAGRLLLESKFSSEQQSEKIVKVIRDCLDQ